MRLLATLLALLIPPTEVAAVVHADAESARTAPSKAGFPGQFAPAPATWRFPVWPAACRRLGDVRERLACDEFVLDDWPRLSRYARANGHVVAPKPGELRVVLIGDSITDDWPRKAEFFPGKAFYNRGIGGQTTAQMLVRFRADVVALRPAAAVIHGGINDLGGNAGPTTIEAIQDNLASMADLARANGIKALIASVLPVSPRMAPTGVVPTEWAARKNLNVQGINDWMRRFCAERGHTFVDYFSATWEPATRSLREDFTHDGLHPNAAGYAVMSVVLEEALSRVLER